MAQDRGHITSRLPESASLSHTGAAVSVNPTIRDGLLAHNDARRAEHEKLARDLDLEDVSQQTALEVMRTAASAIGEATRRVHEGVAAWSAKDVDRHLAFYDHAYAPPGSTPAAGQAA